jgi:hypothetical protein
MDIHEMNQLIASSMKKRGFTHLERGVKVEKLDGHFYFESNPLSISKSKRFNTPELKVRLKAYSQKHDVFISYGARYTFVHSRNDFIERHAFSYDYLYILKVIRSILEETNILVKLRMA